MEKRKKILISTVLILIFIISGCSVKTEDKYLVKNHLDDVIVKIDDVEYCFGDIGYYITNGEAAVESQALVYNPDDPTEYWNKHTNGIFIRVEARDSVMNNFVKDVILSSEAENQGLSLTDEQKQQCSQSAQTILGQLNNYQKEQAGLTADNIDKALQRACLAQSYIEYKLQNEGSNYTQDDWNLDGVCYKAILENHKVKVITKIWEKPDFGNITIER